MILHLLTNEQFTDYAVAQFSAPEMQSEFVLIPSNHEDWKMKLVDRCTIIEQNSPEFEALLNRLDQYSGIILHGMFWPNWQKPILDRTPKNIKVAWMFWGGEIYGQPDITSTFLAPITNFVSRLRSIKKRTKSVAPQEDTLDLYQHIDYCLTDMREEYEYAKNYTGASFEHIWYNYYSIEETIGSLKDKQCKGGNILIGNSASIKNNHLDVLWQLWKFGLLRSLQDRKVIMPLSYGGPWVHNLVKKVGTFVLGKRLQVLDTYIPREEYNALMLSCSTLILGYWEPAAQGNIITGLWLGMRVYLSERSFAYQYFKRIGCAVYSIEKDLKQYGYTPMAQKDVEQNRAVLLQWYAKENMHKRNLEIVKALS